MSLAFSCFFSISILKTFVPLLLDMSAPDDVFDSCEQASQNIEWTAQFGGGLEGMDMSTAPLS